MTNAKGKETKQEQELKSCPVAAALAPVRQLKKGEQVSALIFEGGGTKGAAYAGVVKALDAAGLVKDVKHFAGASAGAMTAAILAAGPDGPALRGDQRVRGRRRPVQEIPGGEEAAEAGG